MSEIPKIGCVQHDCAECRAREAQKPVAWMYDWLEEGEGVVRDWIARSMDEVERNHGFNVRPLYF
jgi:hypothetical protein